MLGSYLVLDRELTAEVAGYTDGRMEQAKRALLRKLRKDRKWTQVDLERESGVAQGLISRMEGDPDYQPTNDVLERVVLGLGMSMGRFYGIIENRQATTSESTSGTDLSQRGGSGRSKVSPAHLREERANILRIKKFAEDLLLTANRAEREIAERAAKESRRKAHAATEAQPAGLRGRRQSG